MIERQDLLRARRLLAFFPAGYASASLSLDMRRPSGPYAFMAGVWILT